VELCYIRCGVKRFGNDVEVGTVLLLTLETVYLTTVASALQASAICCGEIERTGGFYFFRRLGEISHMAEYKCWKFSCKMLLETVKLFVTTANPRLLCGSMNMHCWQIKCYFIH
jgi:hypothetical protein